ncbi:hypothetical protein Tco_1114451 [Tanacetum coccineum]|uniref:EF-hand domain-containing protein n=1 Tax=Tanacetum coccineum TaxID=301880 RepID=A0ABQ5IY32_9ASTR
MPEPVVVEPKVVSQPKVWSDSPIIEEYESDSDDEYVIQPSKEQEKPTFSFVNTVQHVKTPRETVKEQNIYSPSPKSNKRNWNGLMSKRLGLGYGFTKKACFDNPQRALKNKGIVDSGCSRHMTGNKAYLAEYQDYNGGPDAQAAEILKLKDQIKKLKRKCKPSISHHRAWLKSVKRLLMKKRLGRKEFGLHGNRGCCKRRQSNETEELNKGSGKKGRSTEELVSTVVPKTVSTARPELSTARPDVDAARQEDSAVEPRTPPTTTSIFDDEDITMAQTLIKMKEEKAKEKRVSIKDIEDSSRPARSILTLKPLPTIDPKDKGKSALEEPKPAKKMTRSDFDAAQIARDVEIARQLQVYLQAEVERERQKEEEASKAAIAETCDEVQAGIDADALFASKLQQEEREEYIIEEREKLLAEIIVAQRKFRAAQRSAEIRSRPLTKSQLRNLMMTYLKNMGGYKHSQLKSNTFAEIQGLYERQKRVIDDFKPIDSDDAVKDSKEAAGIHKQKVLEEPNSTKKTDANLEEEEQLKAFLKIVPDEEGIIDYEVLEKWFSIINWESKFYDFDKHGAKCIYYRIFRFDGSSRWIKTFSEMVTRFDRLDLVELYNLVMKRFETTTPEGVDLVPWGDLRTMFDANAEDELWQNQERWNLKS